MRSIDAAQQPELVEVSQEEVSEILFWSYYYSQGNLPMQKRILEYVGRAHPKWNLPEQIDIDALTDRIHVFVEKGIKAGSHVAGRTSNRGKDLTREELFEIRKDLMSQYDSPLEGDVLSAQKEYLCKKILERMVDSDYKRLKGVMVKKSESGLQKGPFRNSISHFVSYVLENELLPGPASTKDVFTDLLADIRNRLDDPSVWRDVDREHLRLVLDTQKSIHPEYAEDIDRVSAFVATLEKTQE